MTKDPRAGLRPDAVIFDVDGVLVETESSYVEAVVRTVRWLARDAGLGHARVDRAAVHEWKRTGPWNDDWDLSYEMYRRLVAESGRRATRTWDEVRGVFEEIYTRADLELVLRWNATARLREVPALAVMLCPGEHEAAYREAGAGLFVRSLGEVPRLLKEEYERPLGGLHTNDPSPIDSARHQSDIPT